ncbi:MAG: VOC family protein [Bacteroidia bacterium]
MKRVTGLGGVFFKCEDPENMKEWYADHLDIKTDEYGGLFEWCEKGNPGKTCHTAWSPFSQTTKYFAPSTKPYMFNYRVHDLEALMEQLKKEGVEIVGEIEHYDYGKFGWILDPEGNKVELWEPVDENLKKQ